MILVENLYRRYGEFTAVDNVSFSIQPGEIVGLLGHNGAGKTTIMKMLTGYLEPSGGNITISGFDVTEQATEAQQLIGYLPENLPIYPEMTVADYLYYCAKVHNIPNAEINSRIHYAISKTQLQEKALQLISTLSRGFKQRVGVAQSLIHTPKLLILDEPTNGLDPYQTSQMRKLIQELSEEATVILSTHIMQEVDAICDRVLILDSGKLAVDETMASLRKSDTLELKTNATQASVEQLINKHNIKPEFITENNGINTFSLPIAENIDLNEMSANIVERIIAHGDKVYSLYPPHRDLETVFRSVHENKVEVGNA